MSIRSNLADPEPATQDVFSYLFSKRRDYPTDRVIYRVDGSDETLTVRELEQKSRQFAHTLVDRYGVKQGDTVGILASDSIAYPIAYLGILAAGAIVELVPIQAQLTAPDVRLRLAQAKTKLLITDLKLLGMAINACETLPQVKLLVLDGTRSQLNFFSDECPQYYGFRLRTREEAENSVAFVNRTSGSTGNMKSVLTTHGYFIAVLQSTLATVPANTDPDADTWLSSLSLGFFINAKLHIGLNILLGIPVVLMREPFSRATLSIIPRHRITFLFVPPALAADLAAAGTGSTPDVSSIKWLLSAGAPMHEGLAARISALLNGVHVAMEWGTSETLLIAIQTAGHASPPGSSGVLVSGMETCIVDTETGELLPPSSGERRGEIWVRNRVCPFGGYKDNDEANAAAFDADGWYHSGDFGYIDEHKNVFILDRLKELIRVGDGYGVHVSATEIEAVLFEHPAVEQVVVTGCFNDKTAREHPTAFVVLKPDADKDRVTALASLQAWTAERLNGLQRLTGGIIFVSRLPTLGFKINRRALKGLVKFDTAVQASPQYIEV
ncbi:4-coumarate--CoA ligase-like 9 [Lasiodiplodia theobromae]|uniref:4-coumarate--CoA ligase-like 9 n=1 Tax=Lasiodiplodia theobromae TaxID=45133 RepID=A0A5N5D4H4_9PEZI|nr:4-coumarate--CoA ligase-like 9 [Lasiodiplodia theobromae]